MVMFEQVETCIDMSCLFAEKNYKERNFYINTEKWNGCAT